MSNGGEAPPDLPGSEDVGLDEDSSTEDSSAREVLLEETRRQLDRQAAEVEHIDNKAAKTVRYTLLGLAALATAFSFGPNTPKINKIIGLGVFVLLASVCVGVFTYTASRVYVAAPTVLEVDVEGESAESIRDDILSQLADDLDDNEDMLSGDAFFLSITQLLFLLGIVIMAIGLWQL
jgi:hypothetical protein